MGASCRRANVVIQRDCFAMFCQSLTFSPKALIPCVQKVLCFDSNIIFRAAWMSRSSLYPHGHSYTRSASVMSFFNPPHTGQYFVVGSLDDSTVTRSCFTSLAFTSPNTECCTVLPNKPLCQPRRFSSCIYTCSCSNRSCTILLATSLLRLVNLLYALCNNFLALYRHRKGAFAQLLEPFLRLVINRWHFFIRSLSLQSVLYF